MHLEVGEPFLGSTRFVDACFDLEDTLNKVHDLPKTPLEGSCDVFIHEESPNLGLMIVFCPIHLII